MIHDCVGDGHDPETGSSAGPMASRAAAWGLFGAVVAVVAVSFAAALYGRGRRRTREALDGASDLEPTYTPLPRLGKDEEELTVMASLTSDRLEELIIVAIGVDADLSVVTRGAARGVQNG